jgi:hypothetical protein
MVKRIGISFPKNFTLRIRAQIEFIDAQSSADNIGIAI